MTPEQAKRAITKMFGKRAAWRYDERAPKAEEREAIKASLPALAKASEDAKAALYARRAELLKDPEYVRLSAAANAAREAHEKAKGRAWHYRVTIMRDVGIALEVVAHGDNWQEAIDNARAKVKS